MSTLLNYRFYVIALAILMGALSTVKAQSDCACDQFNGEFKTKFDKLLKQNKLDSARIMGQKIVAGKGCCVAVGNILLANTYLQENQFDSILNYVSKAEKSLGKKYDTLVSPEIYRLRGMVEDARSNPEQAIFYYMAGLKQSEAHGNKGYMAKFYNEISHTYASINQPDKSIPYMRKCAKLAEELNDDLLCAMAYANLIASYGMMHENTHDNKYIDTMQALAPVALQYAKSARDPMYIIRGYMTQGGIAIQMQDYERSLAYSDTVLAMLPPAGMEQLQISALYRKGQSLLQLKRVDEAFDCLHAALAKAKAFRSPTIVSLITQQLYYTHNDLKHADSALYYLQSYMGIRDSLLNAENMAKVAELEQKYQKIENEKTISDLNNKNRLNTLQIRILIAGIALALMITLVVFLYYRQKSLKHKQTILETEQRLNRARMNPHFFFNALAALQGFALRENDGKAIATNLSKFSHIMRETLESTYKDYVTVGQEMEFLEEYLTLQQIRFPQSFSYMMSADALGDPDAYMIPSMIIQPFVENSIEHGFKGLDYKGELTILFDTTENEVVISILDNGKGLQSNPNNQNEHISRASQIIKDRIYLLNLKLKTNANFSIANQPSGKGVEVIIRLPKIKTDESVNH